MERLINLKIEMQCLGCPMWEFNILNTPPRVWTNKPNKWFNYMATFFWETKLSLNITDTKIVNKDSTAKTKLNMEPTHQHYTKRETVTQ